MHTTVQLGSYGLPRDGLLQYCVQLGILLGVLGGQVALAGDTNPIRLAELCTTTQVQVVSKGHSEAALARVVQRALQKEMIKYGTTTQNPCKIQAQFQVSFTPDIGGNTVYVYEYRLDKVASKGGLQVRSKQPLWSTSGFGMLNRKAVLATELSRIALTELRNLVSDLRYNDKNSTYLISSYQGKNI